MNTLIAMDMVAMMGSPGGGEQQGGAMNMIVMMGLIFGIFYFMLIRPQQRKEKERLAMIDNVKTGERIMFCGGLIGTVTNVKDGMFVVKIAEGVKIEGARGAVNKVLEKGERAEADKT